MPFRIVLLSLFSSTAFAGPWFHIELGAANYGADGHTQRSQRMTVGQKLEVSDSPNYIDGLPMEDPFCHVPDIQYKILFDTLDGLVADYGTDDGVFHVNDLFADYTEFAVERLREYAARKGYHRLVVEAVSGDYTKINPRETLQAYRASFYDSAHLKNPEVSFFMSRMDGDKMFSNETSRCEGRRTLQKLANLSKSGLQFTVVHSPYFVPLEEAALMENQIFYKSSTARIMPYHFPEGGKVIPETMTWVLHVPARWPESYAMGEACARL